ncbi:hypothetical protein EIP91_003275 [Steccherinum ochraceum]|uniref:Peroxidase n=1 Tax=Steccherinum ochraceum TaxID=92696 RepID=A0A4R0REC0_9APHY|nr:hypothetical protein EIP91_003275 [Steccherinum ochraceum]
MLSLDWNKLLRCVTVATVLSGVPSAQAYTWPNPLMEELDSQVYDRSDYNARKLPTGMRPSCGSFVFGEATGRANVGDWLRVAYHDMATHNKTDGTGGLDASIRFEESRDENAGDGFFNTIFFISPFANRYFSLADDIALAAVTAVEMCGGPKIAFRGGRVDAQEANAPGVPEPQQTLDEHIASFDRQGFTQEEMIGLVACGHSFGGVQNVAFPTIVPPSNDPNNTSGNAPFDSTFTEFDNKVVTEYLDGTTQNPLVIGPNVTTRSDFRIFNSDNNATMSKFADSSVFMSTCADLLARMINTVPSTVTLTEEVQPLPIKPTAMTLSFAGNGNIQLKGEVRFWNGSSDSDVKLFWKSRDGTTSPDFSVPLTLDTDHVTEPLVPGFPSLKSLWYDLPAISVNATQSISSFWFEVDGKVEDQNGVGYAMQDIVMMSNGSCLLLGDGTNVQLVLKFAIRADVKPSRVYLKADALDSSNAPIVQTTDLPLTTPESTLSGYNVWSATVASPINGWTVAVDVDGKTYETTYIVPGTSFSLSYANPTLCPQ